MTTSLEFKEYLFDQFAAFGPVQIRGMFGGSGIYADGVMFALVADNVLYLKVDDGNRDDFEAADMKPFTYRHKNNSGPVAMPYWEVPAAVLEDSDDLAQWSTRALRAARVAKAAKPGKRKRAKPS